MGKLRFNNGVVKKKYRPVKTTFINNPVRCPNGDPCKKLNHDIGLAPEGGCYTICAKMCDEENNDG